MNNAFPMKVAESSIDLEDGKLFRSRVSKLKQESD